jgi:cyanophycinase
VGSGEYLPEMADLEAGLLAGRPPRYVQLATAAVPDGAEVVRYWHRLGEEQAKRLGVEPVVVAVADRDDADDAAWAARVEGAGLIYLSGGHPGYLAAVLGGTAVWSAIVQAWRGGAALAGCSAGAMAFASWVPSLRRPGSPPEPGLGLLPQVRVVPHFDRFSSRGGARDWLMTEDAGVTVLGIDENTALVGGPGSWAVHGRGQVHDLSSGLGPYRAGATLTLPG